MNDLLPSITSATLSLLPYIQNKIQFNDFRGLFRSIAGENRDIDPGCQAEKFLNNKGYAHSTPH
jgi:hypothetical protein